MRPNGQSWSRFTWPMILPMVIAKEVGTRMTKEYFEIEALKATCQDRLRKGVKIFGSKGYQVVNDEVKKNVLGKECIDMVST